MKSFNYYNPTEIIFGKKRINEVGQKVLEYTKTKNILVVASTSLVKNHLVDEILTDLKNKGINYEVLTGIVPNPNLGPVYEGVKICQEKSIDFILAIGGASVIDTAKTIGVALYHDTDIWSLICNPQNIKGSIPLGVIITLYGSGSEMTNGAVITNLDIPKKRGFDSKYMFPKFAILDAEVLDTVPNNYLLIGMSDMFSHVLETYMEITNEVNASDAYLELLAKDMVQEFAKLETNTVDNSHLLWLSTLAQNKFFNFDKSYNGEWVAHIIAHEFCLQYNLPHGLVVAIIFLAWLDFIKDINEARMIKFGKSVYGSSVKTASDTILKIKATFKQLKVPNNLKELGVLEQDLNLLVKRAMTGKKLGVYKNLTEDDVLKIVKKAYEGE